MIVAVLMSSERHAGYACRLSAVLTHFGIPLRDEPDERLPLPLTGFSMS